MSCKSYGGWTGFAVGAPALTWPGGAGIGMVKSCHLCHEPAGIQGAGIQGACLAGLPRQLEGVVALHLRAVGPDAKVYVWKGFPAPVEAVQFLGLPAGPGMGLV